MYEINATRDFRRDLVRLGRFSPTLVRELYTLIDEDLFTNGQVAETYKPHVLKNRGGHYNNCMEFHLAENVLVLYSPANPKDSITLRRICTHEELLTGRFGEGWPR